MDSRRKIELLSQSARFDLCGSGCKQAPRVRRDAANWVYPATLPDGSTVRLLKVLMTNACRNDCSYCTARCSRRGRRSGFRPEELARLFDDMRRARLVTGLFLSSGVNRDPDHSMGRMIAAAELLRQRYAFRGYIHMKVLPGASRAAAERAAALADRISINLEAPTAMHLRRIAPDKDFRKDVLPRLRWIQDLVRDPAVRAKSHTTQFVVGAAEESDREIVDCVQHLYSGYRLGRAYYSAYQRPDEDAPCQAPPVPLTREHRLYQADWLMRKYGFDADEMVYDGTGNLSLSVDPKMAWAQRHPEFFPVEVNDAPRRSLLRVPGIGPVSADRICTERIRRPLRVPRDLARLGAVASRALPYVLFSGRRPMVERQATFA